MAEETAKKELFAFRPNDERLANALRQLIRQVLRRSPLDPRQVCGLELI